MLYTAEQVNICEEKILLFARLNNAISSKILKGKNSI